MGRELYDKDIARNVEGKYRKKGQRREENKRKVKEKTQWEENKKKDEL